jgi:signal peptidase II
MAEDLNAQPSAQPTEDATNGSAALPIPLGDVVAPEPLPSARHRAAPYWFLGVVTLISLGLDLVTKEWAMGAFEGARKSVPHQIVVVKGFLSLIYAKNKGGAWGLLQNENESLRRPFFLIVSVVAIVFIVSLYRRLAPGQSALKWGLPLVLGGALGNLIDRVRYGYVVDFIDNYLTWGGVERHWPTYNVADISICIGVGLMAIDMFTPRRKSQPAIAASLTLAGDAPLPLGPAVEGGAPLVAAEAAVPAAALEPLGIAPRSAEHAAGDGSSTAPPAGEGAS